MGQIVCSKCGSNNVFIQQVQTGSKGVTTVKGKKHHSFLYKSTIGLVVLMFKIIMFPMILLFKMFFGHRDAVQGTTDTVNSYATMCTCQNCGNSWKM